MQTVRKMAIRLARPMPTEASDIAGPVHKAPFLRKQNLKPAVIYNRYKYVSNTKPASFYRNLKALWVKKVAGGMSNFLATPVITFGNSLISRNLEATIKISTAPTQLIAQLSLIEEKRKVK